MRRSIICSCRCRKAPSSNAPLRDPPVLLWPKYPPLRAILALETYRPQFGTPPVSVLFASNLTDQGRLSPFVYPSRRSATAASALMNSWQMRLKLPGGAYQATRRRAPAGETTLSWTVGGGGVRRYSSCLPARPAVQTYPAARPRIPIHYPVSSTYRISLRSARKASPRRGVDGGAGPAWPGAVALTLAARAAQRRSPGAAQRTLTGDERWTAVVRQGMEHKPPSPPWGR